MGANSPKKGEVVRVPKRDMLRAVVVVVGTLQTRRTCGSLWVVVVLSIELLDVVCVCSDERGWRAVKGHLYILEGET